MNNKLYFAKVKPNAIIPSKREEDAAYDIYANFEEKFILINPHETRLIPTGIASACSSDYYIQLLERGSTGTKGIGQRCGVIDSGYRNEWFVPITNHSNKTLIIAKEGFEIKNIYEGDEIMAMLFGSIMNDDNFIIYPYTKAICQAVVLPVPKMQVEEIPYEDLKKMESERGMGNRGSSDK